MNNVKKRLVSTIEKGVYRKSMQINFDRKIEELGKFRFVWIK